ncbi:MAG: ketose-bisphosphate aldolase [Eubacteriales bacterium]|nr:ketose-bisphosphate aldolase [Eubacteriales bacterium]
MLINLKEMLSVAKDNHFAVPAFNVSDYSMFKALMELTEEMNAPIIIAIHPNELKHIGTSMVQGVIDRLNKSKVPSVVHLDHGASYEQAIWGIQNGFTSVMIDASMLPFEENIAICKKVVEAAHPVNVSVEGELGTIGTADNFGEAGSMVIKYTDPMDAKKFVEATGIDCLAVAIGTCHGLYPKGVDPKLRLDILEDIVKTIPETPLVLHGGSANPDDEIAASVDIGVNKINISSDIKAAYYVKMREVLKDMKLREPMDIQPECMEAMKVVAKQKIELFKADGKASLY